jgi:hypothetical protein
MYYICKFFDSWTFFENDTRISRVIPPEDVALINRFFPDLVENKIFSSIQISLVNPTKLSSLLASKTAAVATYYLCKLLETWSIFEQHTGNSKILTPTEVARMIGMFPALPVSSGICAFQAVLINPGKLINLPIAPLAQGVQAVPLETSKKEQIR